ncbi:MULTISPECIES: type II toxin-antitoxin system RelE/ParE family toxin [unclassified Rhizobium]|uniref:type II toxin-antitoxin system RelE/ParE family toxin n=1 Tax=unclassified Rhizobium TaxID=2613769 RepID=UPI001ADCCA19|nr:MULTISPECIES: type II toxin-antitoxin system RelE/ParE family toxin [unclassified Rhizobium]MBO9126014.1 type II toxin-antitoxin system RelE/ParE family toxin [Rhizobium sp. 16-488-2b]MBO9176598.1 type II toxin-antitoxin system RelE/ParE family toxin [Rhizobium sp. 16-488-2a]
MSARHRSYRISPRARQDLDDIWLYTFQTWSKEQADSYYRGLVGCFPELASGAKRGRFSDSVRPGYRAFAYQSHFIVYKETDRLVTIIRVLHRRMNIEAHL